MNVQNMKAVQNLQNIDCFQQDSIDYVNHFTLLYRYTVNRGSYMSAHELLILLNELGKR